MAPRPDAPVNRTSTIGLVALATAGAALAVALFAAISSRPAPAPGPAASPAQASLAMATCTGAVAESPDHPFWKIELDRCDKAIDGIDVQSGFVTKWSICGGAKSFEVSLDPRAVIVSSDAVHCSNMPSEVSVTYIGRLKK